jgi:hypothetical protein
MEIMSVSRFGRFTPKDTALGSHILEALENKKKYPLPLPGIEAYFFGCSVTSLAIGLL